MKVSLR
jgi:hypothetical protein